MSEESYEDVWEITQLDKIWKAQPYSKFEKFVAVPIVLLFLFIVIGLIIAIVGICLFLLIDTIIAYLSGREPEHLGILIAIGIIAVLFSLIITVFVLLVSIYVEGGDLRYLIRFKIFAVDTDFSEDDISIIEALTRALESNNGWTKPRNYKREKWGNTRLQLIQEYLMKKYQRDVTVNECLQFFSIGEMSIDSGSKHRDYSFVIHDEKEEEILFYCNDYKEWLYLREELEEKGFYLSEIRETIVDMADYVINDDRTIERKKKRREGNTFSLENSEIKNV